MNDINEIFRKFWPQTVHIVAIPAFFFCFMMIYTPYGAEGYFSDMKLGYPFHLAMLTCIIAASEGLSRSILYIFRRKINRTAYLFWCLMDMVSASIFMGLYIWLMKRTAIPYFSAAAWSFGTMALTTVYPYVIIPGIARPPAEEAGRKSRRRPGRQNPVLRLQKDAETGGQCLVHLLYQRRRELREHTLYRRRQDEKICPAKLHEEYRGHLRQEFTGTVSPLILREPRAYQDIEKRRKRTGVRGH